MVKIINAQLEELQAQLKVAEREYANPLEVARIEAKLEVLYDVLIQAITQGVNDPELFKK